MPWFGRIFFLAASSCLLSPSLLSAQSAEDLPSAPSAVLHEKTPPAPQPQPAPKPPPAPAAPQAAGNAGEPLASVPAEDAGPAEEHAPTMRVNVNEVNVVFTVTDKHNHYIRNLGRNDFKVIDDDKPVEEIRSFRRETNLPLRVGLLVDASNSVRDRFKFEQESAVEFLSQTVRPHYDQAFVVGFDTEVEVTQDFTDDSEALAAGVHALRPGGGTSLYDALYFACRDKLMKLPESSGARRAVVLVSDGDDNSSHVTREEAIDMALRANAIVYTISTNFPGGGKGDKVLERIADATGGRAFEPFQLTDVANAFALIQDELRSQYELSYRPADFRHDGRFRRIEIMAEHKGLKVRSRHGYYAPTE
jgi:VWFA-related protein